MCCSGVSLLPLSGVAVASGMPLFGAVGAASSASLICYLADGSIDWPLGISLTSPVCSAGFGSEKFSGYSEYAPSLAIGVAASSSGASPWLTGYATPLGDGLSKSDTELVSSPV
jgi:hypothetical protein